MASKFREIPIRRGLDDIRLGVARVRTAFPDWHEEVFDIFGCGEKVVSRYVSRDTHRGLYWGVQPSGLRIEVQEISIFRCGPDERVVEQWCPIDELARLQSLRVSDTYLRKVLRLPGGTTLRDKAPRSRLTTLNAELNRFSF